MKTEELIDLLQSYGCDIWEGNNYFGGFEGLDMFDVTKKYLKVYTISKTVKLQYNCASKDDVVKFIETYLLPLKELI